MKKETDSEILQRWRKERTDYVKKFRKKALAEGRRHVACMLSLQATEALNQIQARTGEKASVVIQRLLLENTAKG